ncbi:hypothetical protein HMPREF0541_00268, partial [Lacticaseibacillus rhamnosus ATCC 21052]
LGRNDQNPVITSEAACALVYAHNALPGAGTCSVRTSAAMAKPGPSRLRPLTLRFLTAPVRAYHKKKAGAWPAKNMIGFYERLTGAVFFPDR